jgi:hypothetical protein
MFWLFVPKKIKNKNLHFGLFDEGVHGLPKMTICSLIDLKDSKF